MLITPSGSWVVVCCFRWERLCQVVGKAGVVVREKVGEGVILFRRLWMMEFWRGVALVAVIGLGWGAVDAGTDSTGVGCVLKEAVSLVIDVALESVATAWGFDSLSPPMRLGASFFSLVISSS